MRVTVLYTKGQVCEIYVAICVPVRSDRDENTAAEYGWS